MEAQLSPMRGLLCSIAIGIGVLAIPASLWGAYDAWARPTVEAKNHFIERTIAGNALWLFLGGAIAGGSLGAIAGLVIAGKRL